MNWRYSGTPEIETVGLSQSHVGLNFSKFLADCLFRIDSNKQLRIF